ncbi:MAG: hypothetical protein ACREBS_05780 [Nitrososphaerales archaeon]
MNAIDASLETVSVVFLLAAMLYSAKLLQLTKDAQIVALSKPKTVFRMMALAFAFLLLSPLLGLVSDFYQIRYVAEVQLCLIILTGFFGVMAIYTALYFYRTSPERARIPIAAN